MAQATYTPISLYYSATASAVPLAANLVAGELALNTNDGKLYYKNSSNVVTLLASNAATTNVSSITFGSTGLTPSTATTGAVTVAGTLVIANGGTAQTSFTAGQIHFGSFSTSANLFWDNTNGRLGIGTNSPAYSLDVVSATARIYNDAATLLFQRPTNSRSGSIGLTGATGAIQYYSGVNGSGESGSVAHQFYSDSPATLTALITVLGNGRTGFGTVSPTSLLQTAGSSSLSAFKTPNIAEVDTISATAATGTINYDVTTQSVLYYTSNASGNFTVNFRGSSGTTLNTVMQTGESISATFLVTNGATAYYNSAVTIDGTSVTPKWQGGTAPTSGNASSIDSYTYVIQKTGSATYVVLASQTKFA